MTDRYIPYGHQVIDEDDIAMVVATLRSEWLTTGPMIPRFERAFADYLGAGHATCVSSGSAALHLAMIAAGVGPGDEVIVPALTFAASASCVRHVGGTVVFADVCPDTLTLDPARVAELITARTKAVVPVHYAGLPCDMDPILALAADHGLAVIEDACHALGAEYHQRKIGAASRFSCFSLHPVKHMTTGEGGVVTTDDADVARHIEILRNHGITADHHRRQRQLTWRYDVAELGFNYRLSDLQCALGVSQLAKVPTWLARREAIARRYDEAFSSCGLLRTPARPPGRRHAFHLYPVQLSDRVVPVREQVFMQLRQRGIGVNVHYLPLYLHSYYRALGYGEGLCPVSERAYESLLSLPMWHGMSDDDVTVVIESVLETLERHSDR